MLPSSVHIRETVTAQQCGIHCDYWKIAAVIATLALSVFGLLLVLEWSELLIFPCAIYTGHYLLDLWQSYV